MNQRDRSICFRFEKRVNIWPSYVVSSIVTHFCSVDDVLHSLYCFVHEDLYVLRDEEQKNSQSTFSIPLHEMS